MKLKQLTSAIATTALVVAGLVGVTSPAAAAPTTVKITPDPGYASASFEGWGTSLVWFANATGGYPESVRRDLLDKVFGEDGLNLNIARYNIGGGNATDVPPYLRAGGAVQGWWNPNLNASDSQGTITSKYADRARYAAAWNPDDPNAYNPNADSTQRWWIDAVKDKITHWEAFSNTPPYFLTQSGYASGGFDANAEQLAPADMDKFAGYLVNVVERLEQTHGITIDTLDPFNEPSTNYWRTDIGSDGWPTTRSRQEGAHIGPQRQDQMIQALSNRLARSSTVADVAISAMDETNPSLFVDNWNGWSNASQDRVDQLNVHTYGTNGRTAARDVAKAADKPLWMSEVEGNWDTSGAGFNQTNIDNGLGVASHMIGDLRELEPDAWVFWQPVEDLYNMQKVERANWGSIYIDFDCDANGQSARRIADGDADTSCKVLTNAKFNTVRNFTHYIRPGDRLIASDNGNTAAALGADGTQATLVHVNSDSSERTVQIDLSKFAQIASGAKVTPIVTTESPASNVTANALVTGQAVAVDLRTRTATLTVPAKSVTTFVIDGVSGAASAPFADGTNLRLDGVQSGKALTVEGSALTIRPVASGNQASTQTWTVQSVGGDAENRRHIALRAGDGRYLASAGSNLTVVSADASRASTDAALQWIPSTLDGESYSLLNIAAELTLDVNGASTADGASVGLFRSNAGSNQEFTPVDLTVTPVNQPITHLNSNRCLDVPGASTQNGTQPALWDCSGANHQRFTYTAAKEIRVYGNKCLDVSGGGATAGTAVLIWDCNGQGNQKWSLNGDGAIVGAASNLCLVPAGARTDNGAPAQLSTCSGASAQRWSFPVARDAVPGNALLAQTNSQKCADVPGASTQNGTQLALWDCSGNTNQRFTYTSVGEIRVYGNKCLDASNAGTTPGTAVLIWDCNGQNNQKWTVNGSGAVTSNASNLCLTTVGGRSDNTAPLELSTCNGAPAQKWSWRN